MSTLPSMPVCPSCGEEIPEGARFCSSCGAPLGVGRKERKFATALFADLVGSTELGERQDPEVVEAVVGRAFDRLSEEVERHGGLVEKYMGDALLAVFGVPAAHEDDPERAVRAALEMQAVLSALNGEFRSEGKPELRMRIGVEAGEILVDAEHPDRMLTGDAVNTASRLQAVAQPGHVVVGVAVQDSTKAVIEYRALPALDIKGKAAPVTAWRALRVGARRRGERAPLGFEARLIGRDEELALLRQTFHRVEAEGRAALVTVLGPAGVGKSRLAWELLQFVEELPQVIHWRKGRCLAYGGVSYSALAEAVKAQCEILEDDPPELVAEKVERAVEQLFGDRSVVPQILALVGPKTEQRFTREQLFEAWRRFLERMAARYPLVLVLEDLHWADAGLLDFVEHLADWAEGPIQVLALARPELLELRPGWGGGKRNYAALSLDPLTPKESEAMLDDLLATSLPTEVKQLVVERSEGNPLFTEEIVRMFVDRGVLRSTDTGGWELAVSVDSVDVPHSIHALIAARLDNLPFEEKSVLQDAAVVGRVFWVGTAARLSGLATEEARVLLGRLRVKEIIVPRDPPVFSDDLEFAFRHVLIRDVAYESLPKALRATKHAEVARWADERAGERREEIAELIATHYSEALRYLEELGEGGGRPELQGDAYRWARVAADRARGLWQITEALRWYRRALELAESLDIAASELARLWEDYGRTADGFGLGVEVRQAYEEAARLYEEQGRGPDAARVQSHLAAIAFKLGQDEAVLPLVEGALDRLELLGESRDLAAALHMLGWYQWRRGRLEEAEKPLRRSMEMAERVGALSVQGHATQTLGLTLLDGGRWPEGLPLVEESYRIAQQADNLTLLLRCANNVPAVLVDYAPGLERGLAILREGLELAERAGQAQRGWILGTLGDYMVLLGRLDEAERYQDQAVEIARTVADRPLLGQRLQSLAGIKVLQGNVEEAQGFHHQAEEILAENPELQVLAYQATDGGRIALAKGEVERALESFLDGVVRLGASIKRGGGETLLAELVWTLVKAGRREEALIYRDLLRKVAAGRPPAEAFANWADGLLAEGPAVQVEVLGEAARRFENLGRPVGRARCLIDLAEAESRAGRDPVPTLEGARQILADCGAGLYLRQVEEALAASAG